MSENFINISEIRGKWVIVGARFVNCCDEFCWIHWSNEQWNNNEFHKLNEREFLPISAVGVFHDWKLNWSDYDWISREVHCEKFHQIWQFKNSWQGKSRGTSEQPSIWSQFRSINVEKSKGDDNRTVWLWKRETIVVGARVENNLICQRLREFLKNSWWNCSDKTLIK